MKNARPLAACRPHSYPLHSSTPTSVCYSCAGDRYSNQTCGQTFGIGLQHRVCLAARSLSSRRPINPSLSSSTPHRYPSLLLQFSSSEHTAECCLSLCSLIFFGTQRSLKDFWKQFWTHPMESAPFPDSPGSAVHYANLHWTSYGGTWTQLPLFWACSLRAF